MAIIHTKKRENPYVQIDKRCLEDRRLSWRAKGILAYLLSKPDEWQVSIQDLQNKAKEGREAVQATLKELKANGYANLELVKGDKGEFGGKRWIINEEPTNGFPVYPKEVADKRLSRPSETSTIGETDASNNIKEVKNKRRESEKPHTPASNPSSTPLVLKERKVAEKERKSGDLKFPIGGIVSPGRDGYSELGNYTINDPVAVEVAPGSFNPLPFTQDELNEAFANYVPSAITADKMMDATEDVGCIVKMAAFEIDEKGKAVPAPADFILPSQLTRAETAEELQSCLREFFRQNPTYWTDSILKFAEGQRFTQEKREEMVKDFCIHQLKIGHGSITYRQQLAAMQYWFRNEKIMTWKKETKTGYERPVKMLGQ